MFSIKNTREEMATIKEIFNGHRQWALVLFIVSAICIWYSLVLITNPSSSRLVPNKQQWIGFIVAIVLAFGGWLGRCLTIIPE